MNVVYKSAGKYKHLRGTPAYAKCVKFAISGVVYTAVVGGLFFLVVPRDIVKPFLKPFEPKQTRLSKKLEEITAFDTKDIKKDFSNL